MSLTLCETYELWRHHSVISPLHYFWFTVGWITFLIRFKFSLKFFSLSYFQTSPIRCSYVACVVFKPHTRLHCSNFAALPLRNTQDFTAQMLQRCLKITYNTSLLTFSSVALKKHTRLHCSNFAAFPWRNTQDFSFCKPSRFCWKKKYLPSFSFQFGFERANH
jgi:hypothetical protein